MGKPQRKIRRSHYISPFGVGAIIDIGGESFIAEDILEWKKYNQEGERIALKRLSVRLHVSEFRMPVSGSDFFAKYTPKVPFYRFPRWLFCPKCRYLKKWVRGDEQGGEPLCANNQCKGAKQLVPMRFVAACEKGHLQDIDWASWAHKDASKNIPNNGRCEIKDKLKFMKFSEERGGGLNSIGIFCEACKSKRTLEGITSKDALKAIGSICFASQPWERKSEKKCDETPQVIQKGASNLYYPITISALDIPLSSEEASTEIEDLVKEKTQYAEILTEMNNVCGQDGVLKYLAKKIADLTGCAEDFPLELARKEMARKKDGEIKNEDALIDESEILREEWTAILNPSIVDHQHGGIFVSKEEKLPQENLSFGLDGLIHKLILVPKLREVRVLRGFSRLKPNAADFVSVDLGQPQGWLPATEVFGEGIFISLSENAIKLWVEKNNKAISVRIKNIQDEYEKRSVSFITAAPTPRFILLHTLAHLLIRQLSFECGYGASSLKEKIYCEDPSANKEPMAGILIYTADSDSEGAMGGLVRQGKQDRFISTLITALERGTWCSADPVCQELPGQGLMGLNRAACHACALASETSCVNYNTLLDRMLLVGDDEVNGSFGFFSAVVSRFSEETLK